MTADEVATALATLAPGPDAQVRIEAFGGMRSGKPIKAARVGFDWDAGSVVLVPERALALYPLPQSGPDPAWKRGFADGVAAALEAVDRALGSRPDGPSPDWQPLRRRLAELAAWPAGGGR